MNLDPLSIIDKVSPIVIFKADERGMYTYVNQKWTEISGYSIEETLGEGWIETIHPEDRESTKNWWKANINNKSTSHSEYRIVTTKNEVKWLVVRVAAEVSANGNITGFIGSATDITERKNTESALRESEQMNRSLVENSPNAIVIQKFDTTIVFSNKKALELLEAYDEKQILGRSTREFIVEKDLPGIGQRFKEIVSTGKRGEPYEFGIKGINGRVFIGESIAVPFQWKEKPAILLVIRDITLYRENLKRLENTEKQLRQFVEDAPVAVAMFDLSMNYISCSNRWIKDWWKKEEKVTPEFMIGQNHYTLFPDVGDYWKKVHRRVLRGASESNEEDFFIDINNETHWLRWEALPWHKTDGDIGGIMIFTEFITARKKAEEELKVLADKLIKSNKELQQFAYITSHNLRAPVVNLDTLLGFYDPKAGDQADNQAIFKKILTSVDQLKSSLGDLINLIDSKEAKNRPPTEVYFEEILQQVERNLETQILSEEALVKSNFSRAPKILFEPSVLESILQNLITNALKYRSDSAPVIEIKSSDFNDYVVLTVKDNGIGMDLNKVGPKLFGMYQRFNDTKEGKGLGLYIVKSQIESFGGRIEVKTELNKGTTFIVYFKKG